jgi:tetratricopeptide (TPR) repeat protein
MLGLLFYAPARGIRLASERGRFLVPVLFAVLVSTLYTILLQGRYYLTLSDQPPLLIPPLRSAIARWAFVTIGSFFWSAVSISLIGLIFAPVVIYLTARSAGRITLSAALQRDYVRVAPAIFCACGVGYFWGGIVGAIIRFSGALTSLVQWMLPSLRQAAIESDSILAKLGPEGQQAALAISWLIVIPLPAIALLLWVAVRLVCQVSVARSLLITAAGCLAVAGIQLLLSSLPGALMAAPILIAMSFLVLRASFLSAVEKQRAAASFAQAVLVADRSPHDARAQYDLGVMLLERGETPAAAVRFEQALARDPDDNDTHFQLGRIARLEGRWEDAIKHFEPVVANEFNYAGHEIWREVGATYLGAGQFADAVDALERFLDHRPEDAEGWCLLGQAQAGLGNKIEATAAMHACLSATEGMQGAAVEPSREWRSRAEDYLRRAGK